MAAAQPMEAEISTEIGAERGEVAPDSRSTHRNGYRDRAWDTLLERSSCRSRRSARAGRISRRFWTRGGGVSRRSWRW